MKLSFSDCKKIHDLQFLVLGSAVSLSSQAVYFDFSLKGGADVRFCPVDHNRYIGLQSE